MRGSCVRSVRHLRTSTPPCRGHPSRVTASFALEPLGDQDLELVALGTARTQGAREITAIVAVGNHGGGVVGPCGRDRQVLLDYHPGVRVILPTEQGVMSAPIAALMPFAARWSIENGIDGNDSPAIHKK